LPPRASVKTRRRDPHELYAEQETARRIAGLAVALTTACGSMLGGGSTARGADPRNRCWAAGAGSARSKIAAELRAARAEASGGRTPPLRRRSRRHARSSAGGRRQVDGVLNAVPDAAVLAQLKAAPVLKVNARYGGLVSGVAPIRRWMPSADVASVDDDPSRLRLSRTSRRCGAGTRLT